MSIISPNKIKRPNNWLIENHFLPSQNNSHLIQTKLKDFPQDGFKNKPINKTIFSLIKSSIK